MSTFTIRGQKVRTQSQRRYVVVACRPADFPGKRWDYINGDYVPYAFTAFKPEILKRSDSLATAVAAQHKYGHLAGGWVAVIDTVTGEEVA